MYYSVQLDTGLQDGTEIYPDYSDATHQIQGVFAFAIGISQFNLSMIQGILLSPSSISVLTAFALTVMILPRSKSRKFYAKQRVPLPLVK